MSRIPHGVITSFEKEATKNVAAHESSPGHEVASTTMGLSALTPFGYLFPNLQNNPGSLLPESAETVKGLIALGETMSEPGDNSEHFSTIPAAYTYFGQFIDHDIAFTSMKREHPKDPSSCDFTKPNFGPFSSPEIALEKLRNNRGNLLQLEVVYNCPALRDGDRLQLGEVSKTASPIQTKDRYHDVPRQGPSPSEDFKVDRAALIGDTRNDNNLIISQLHVAFLRAHNAIVDRGHTFEEARKLLRQHYQWIVIDDYLRRIVAPNIYEETLTRRDPIYSPAGEFFLPLEFNVAAYRFGHSMIRQLYYYNDVFLGVGFNRLSPLKILRDTNCPTLPDNRIIQWGRFVEGGGLTNPNPARQLDTRLVELLLKVFDEAGVELPCESRLAVMDLLRGYMLRMPTGQAVARELNARGRNVPVMAAPQIEAAAEAVNQSQRKVLRDFGFSENTPLWFYILVEAAQLGGGNYLGPVGSTIVAEVIVELVRRSPDPILKRPGSNPSDPVWAPTLGENARQFKLPDLLRLAGVLDLKAT